MEPRRLATIRPSPTLQVEPPDRGYWEDRGWHRRRQRGAVVYEGEYRVRDRRSGTDRSFPGMIREVRGKIEVLVHGIPPELARHPKRPCFRSAGTPGWYQVEWVRRPRNVDEAILYVQQVFDEAINGRR